MSESDQPAIPVHDFVLANGGGRTVRKLAFFILGVIQLICGILFVASGISLLSVGRSGGIYHLGTEYLGPASVGVGVVCAATGVFGVLIKYRPKQRYIIAALVASIFSSCGTFVLFCFAVSSTTVCGNSRGLLNFFIRCPEYAFALLALLSVIIFVAFIVAIVLSAFSCGGTCCRPAQIHIVANNNQPAVTGKV